MLQRIYKGNGIRIKKVQVRKKMPAAVELDFPSLHKNLSVQVAKAQKTQRKIIFLDETVFTKNTMKASTYSSRYSNIEIS